MPGTKSPIQTTGQLREAARGGRNTVSADRASRGTKTVDDIYSSRQNLRKQTLGSSPNTAGVRLPNTDVSDFRSSSTMSTGERVGRGSSKTAEDLTKNTSRRVNSMGSMAGLVNPNKSATIALNGTFYGNPALKKAPTPLLSSKSVSSEMLHISGGKSLMSTTDYRSAGRMSVASKKVLKSLRSHL